MIAPSHIELLRKFSTDESAHSRGRSLYAHLEGVRNLLARWNNPTDVCVAGLFHSSCGTRYDRIQSAALAQRAQICAAIGAAAERLACLFSTTDRACVSRPVSKAFPGPSVVLVVQPSA